MTKHTTETEYPFKMTMGKQTSINIREKDKMLVTSIFSISHNIL